MVMEPLLGSALVEKQWQAKSSVPMSARAMAIETDALAVLDEHPQARRIACDGG
jgi:hypothetical protein